MAKLGWLKFLEPLKLYGKSNQIVCINNDWDSKGLFLLSQMGWVLGGWGCECEWTGGWGGWGVIIRVKAISVYSIEIEFDWLGLSLAITRMLLKFAKIVTLVDHRWQF